MNSIEFNYKKNTILGSIDKYIAYLCDEHDTIVSGYKPEIYADINRLERDYPYTPYLDTFKNLMNKGIAVMMIPILSESSSNNYHSSLIESNKYHLITKQYNIPVTLIVSRWLNYYKWTIISRNYSEEFYVTYNGISSAYDPQPEPTNDIISPKDISYYSEVIQVEDIQDGLPAGTYEFLVADNGELPTAQVLPLRTTAIDNLIGTDWYPDFIVAPGIEALPNDTPTKNLIDKLSLLASDQFSQYMILNNEYVDSFLGTTNSGDNRCMILSIDNYYYEGTNNSFILPFVDMFLNCGKYQMVITDNVLADIYEPNSTSEGIVNSVSYNDLNNYYIDRVYDLPNQSSYFIIRYYISRFSRLLVRNSSSLKSNNTYIRDKFISDTIDKMLIYDNINSIKLVNSEISGQKLSMEFEIEVSYLMNKKINFNVTFNIA